MPCGCDKAPLTCFSVRNSVARVGGRTRTQAARQTGILPPVCHLPAFVRVLALAEVGPGVSLDM